MKEIRFSFYYSISREISAHVCDFEVVSVYLKSLIFIVLGRCIITYADL